MSEIHPVILGFVDNLMFTSRIESVAEQLGCQMEWMAAPGLAESWMDRIIQLAPALILVDLGMDGFPWNSVISQIKEHPASRQIPVVCFGSHKDTDALKKARQAGADQVVARSRFFSALPDLIQKALGYQP